MSKSNFNEWANYFYTDRPSLFTKYNKLKLNVYLKKVLRRKPNLKVIDWIVVEVLISYIGFVLDLMNFLDYSMSRI